jgi:hypothetical protein
MRERPLRTSVHHLRYTIGGMPAPRVHRSCRLGIPYTMHGTPAMVLCTSQLLAMPRAALVTLQDAPSISDSAGTRCADAAQLCPQDWRQRCPAATAAALSRPKGTRQQKEGKRVPLLERQAAQPHRHRPDPRSSENRSPPSYATARRSWPALLIPYRCLASALPTAHSLAPRGDAAVSVITFCPISSAFTACHGRCCRQSGRSAPVHSSSLVGRFTAGTPCYATCRRVCMAQRYGRMHHAATRRELQTSADSLLCERKNLRVVTLALGRCAQLGRSVKRWVLGGWRQSRRRVHSHSQSSGLPVRRQLIRGHAVRMRSSTRRTLGPFQPWKL